MFGFLLSCLGLLLFINVFAKKYLKGDYVKVPDHDDVISSDDEDNDVKKVNKNTTAAPYCEISPDDEILNQNTPAVTVSLRYFQKSRTIEGVVKKLSNTSAISTSLFRFIAWSTAHKKHSGKTTSEKVKNVDIMLLSFVVKPVIYEEMLNSSLCLQLQCNRKMLHNKWKTYGECFIPLNEIVGKVDGVEFKKNLLPVSVSLKDI